MLRYIIRRFLQMIPTVIGVIIVTFILFNLAGGSQARSALGERASVEALEEYDEIRGFNRPLLFGWWTRTRALEDTSFEHNAGFWRDVKGAAHYPPEGKLASRVHLKPGLMYEIPLAFDLREDASYRLRIRYRTAPNSTSAVVVKTRTGVDGTAGTEERETRAKMNPSAKWQKVDTLIESEENVASRSFFVEVGGTDIEVESISLRRRMDSPWHSQFTFYLLQIAHFDFGVSSSTNQRVSDLLRAGIGPSLALTIPIFVVGLFASVSLSLVCAFFRNRFVDRFFVVVAVGLMSINYLIFIIAGQYLLAYRWELFPVWGFESWRYLTLPVLIGVVSGLGSSLRFYRTIMLDEMYRDYVRTAFAKGAGKKNVLFKHVLKNAMVPILTNIVIAIPFLYTGSLLLETFFGIPGLGYLAINAINSSDVDVIRAIVLIGSILFVVANLITDISYAAVDPRVKLP